MFHYDRLMVLIAFRIDNENVRDPSEDDLLDFDEALFSRFGSQLKKQADAAGIPDDTFSRSLLMVFAKQSTEGSPKPQVQDAVEYFLNTVE